MKLPETELFQDVCADVVIRFKGHDSYKARKGAIKAFKKRVPGYEDAIYDLAFDSFCRVYDLSVEAIELFPANGSKGKYSQAEDINSDACLKYIDQVLPGYGNKGKTQILDWVIFWHYLK